VISDRDYKQKPLSYWKTIIVRTNVVLHNGVIEIPVGTKCTITDKRGGFTLKSEPCKLCGVSIFITKVPPKKLSIVGWINNGVAAGS
jgi:hypothetical protein